MTLPASAFPLSVSGASILGADDSPVRLAGINWGGAQQDECVPYGLDKLSRFEIIERIAGWGFNHVRLPFAVGGIMHANGSLRTDPVPAARVSANPDLAGLTPWQVFRQLTDEITDAGLYAIPNQHLLFPGWCCSNADNNGLWYNDNWPASTFYACWELVAGYFADNPRVGFDLHNEPRPATIGGAVRTPAWSSNWAGSYPTDIRDMYQRAANAIRAAVTAQGSSLKHLVFCEGLDYAADLTAWKVHPVTGGNAVPSWHDYPWFHPAGQTLTGYYNQMDARGGYLVTQGIAPIWVGEFGSNTDVPLSVMESGWLPQFISYAGARNLHWCWWELSATGVLGTEPSTNVVKVRPGQREAYGIMAGQDWMGTQADLLGVLDPILP